MCRRDGHHPEVRLGEDIIALMAKDYDFDDGGIANLHSMVGGRSGHCRLDALQSALGRYLSHSSGMDSTLPGYSRISRTARQCGQDPTERMEKSVFQLHGDEPLAGAIFILVTTAIATRNIRLQKEYKGL
jgi:hypothetical protein